MGDYSHSMVNEVAKRLIFQCFPNHSVTNTLKNTLTCKIRYCRLVAAGMGDTSPLARTCHQILLGDNAFISAQQQSKRPDKFKDTPIFSAALSHCHSRNHARYSDRDEAMARAYLSTALPCPTSPPFFTSRARQSVESYRYLTYFSSKRPKLRSCTNGRTDPGIPSCHPG